MRVCINVTVAASVGLLSACVSTPSLEPRFDDLSGVTWTTLSEPIAMAHANPQLSTSTRNYLYVGPIEMNERGVREEYLWLGLATTVPALFTADMASLPESAILDVDGLVFELPLSGWNDPAPYETPATVTHAVTARVSLDQIGLIAGAQEVRLELHNADGSSIPYEHWNGAWVDWVEFRDAVDPEAALTRAVARY